MMRVYEGQVNVGGEAMFETISAISSIMSVLGIEGFSKWISGRDKDLRWTIKVPLSALVFSIWLIAFSSIGIFVLLLSEGVNGRQLYIYLFALFCVMLGSGLLLFGNRAGVFICGSVFTVTIFGSILDYLFFMPVTNYEYHLALEQIKSNLGTSGLYLLALFIIAARNWRRLC